MASAMTASPVAEASLRILIVEDEVLIALELESFLMELGHVIVGIAGHSREAIAMACEAAPDVALVDIHLIDGPTGVEVARRLSADPATAVLFMTANAKRIPADFAGALGVIAKPYSERAVASALAYVGQCRAGRMPSGIPDGFSLAPPEGPQGTENAWSTNTRSGWPSHASAVLRP